MPNLDPRINLNADITTKTITSLKIICYLLEMNVKE
jgi:hypothetical protein